MDPSVSRPAVCLQNLWIDHCANIKYSERGMNRFYILLDGEITQEKAETSIRDHMAPHKVEFKKTEWFSTFESM